MKVNSDCLSHPCLFSVHHWCCTLLMAMVLASCTGSDPGDDGTIGTGIVLRGTVPTNRVFTRNAVEIKHSSGQRSIAIIATETGRYYFATPDSESAFLLRVDLGNNNAYYAVAHAENNENIRQNIHAYSDVAIRNWFALQNLDIDAVFSDTAPINNLPSVADMRIITKRIERQVGPSLAAYNLAGVNLQSVAFDSDDTGVDRFLDRNPVFIENSGINIYVMDPQTETRTVVSLALPVTTDFSAIDAEPPSAPTNLRVLASSNSEIVLAWEPGEDNIGVVAYDIMRNGTSLVTTVYPYYIDMGLQSGTNYEYTIIALDADGNRSEPSVQDSSETLLVPDTTPPPAPANLILKAGTISVELSWSQSSIGDVAGFRILRGHGSTTPMVITQVNSTITSDLGLNSGTEYCYQILARDASGNDSEPSEKACITTNGSIVSTAPAVLTTDRPASQIGSTGIGTGSELTVSAGASIQAVIDSANDGDIIKVAAGVFNESLVLDKQSLTLLGGFSDDFNQRDTKQFVSVLSGDNNRSVISLLSNTGTTIDGFTIRNGQRGVLIDFNGDYVIVSTDITVSNNIIENNGTTEREVTGGGVKAVGNSIHIINNTIRDNFSGRGGGLSTYGSWDYVVEGNLIENNIAYGYHGGGIYTNGKGRFSNNVVRGNRVDDGLGYGWGGGIVTLNYGEGEIHFDNNIWTNNYSPGPGAGVFIDEQTAAFFKNELIFNNTSSDVRTGAELYVDESWTHFPSVVAISNSTIFGSGVLVQDSTVTIKNSIVWDPDTSSDQDENPFNNNFRLNLAGTLDISYSLFQDPTPGGVGNLTADPLFVDTDNGDFHLQSTVGRWNQGLADWVVDSADSPAIDSGDPSDPFDLEPQSNGRVNIGTYGNTSEASK